MRALRRRLFSNLRPHTIMKYLLLPLILAMPLVTTQCNRVKSASNSVASAGDYTLAKNTFEGLTHGDTSVAKNIDWEMLKTPEGDFGAAYMQIPTETEKQTKQKTFILDFASNYQKAGAAVYSNWKVSYHDEFKTEVTADAGTARLVLVVTTRDGKDRLSQITVLQ
jgi:hypothetical protein